MALVLFLVLALVSGLVGVNARNSSMSSVPSPLVSYTCRQDTRSETRKLDEGGPATAVDLLHTRCVLLCVATTSAATSLEVRRAAYTPDTLKVLPRHAQPEAADHLDAFILRQLPIVVRVIPANPIASILRRQGFARVGWCECGPRKGLGDDVVRRAAAHTAGEIGALVRRQRVRVRTLQNGALGLAAACGRSATVRVAEKPYLLCHQQIPEWGLQTNQSHGVSVCTKSGAATSGKHWRTAV